MYNAGSARSHQFLIPQENVLSCPTQSPMLPAFSSRIRAILAKSSHADLRQRLERDYPNLTRWQNRAQMEGGMIHYLRYEA